MGFFGNLILGTSLLLAGLFCLRTIVSKYSRALHHLLVGIFPYHGRIGVVIAIWGLWGFISSLRIMPILRLAPVGMWWFTNLVGSLLNLSVGLFLGFDVFHKHILMRAPEETRRKLEEFHKRLLEQAVPIGFVCVGASLWLIITNIVTTVQWRIL